MSGELESYRSEDALERAIKEGGKQGLLVWAVTTFLDYGSSPESDKNFEESMKFGARQGLKQLLHSFADNL